MTCGARVLKRFKNVSHANTGAPLNDNKRTCTNVRVCSRACDVLLERALKCFVFIFPGLNPILTATKDDLYFTYSRSNNSRKCSKKPYLTLPTHCTDRHIRLILLAVSIVVVAAVIISRAICFTQLYWSGSFIFR